MNFFKLFSLTKSVMTFFTMAFYDVLFSESGLRSFYNMHRVQDSDNTVTDEEVKCYTKQLVKALKQIHAKTSCTDRLLSISAGVAYKNIRSNTACRAKINLFITDIVTLNKSGYNDNQITPDDLAIAIAEFTKVRACNNLGKDEYRSCDPNIAKVIAYNARHVSD